MDNFTIVSGPEYGIVGTSGNAERINYLGISNTVWENFTGSTEVDPSLFVGRATQSRNLFDINYRVRTYLSEPSYIIALTLGFIAISFNILSILALFQIRNRINTHYRLIISLAVSDTLIGISIVMYIVNKVIRISYVPGHGPWNERLISRCMVEFIKALNTTSLNISLLNLMGMSIDHYIAITKPLRYHQLMGKDRARIMIITLWLIAGICGFSDFFSGIFVYKNANREQDYNYCEVVFKTKYQEEYTVLVIAFLCLFVMLFIYLRIYWKVKRHRAPGETGQVNLSRKREEKRNKKALITTLLVLGSFILCWLPSCLYQIILIVVLKLGRQVDITLIKILISADKYLFDVLLLNCICDPIIYTVRCYEVRLGYKRLFGRLFRKKSPPRSRCSKRSSFKTSFMTLPNVDRHALHEWPTAETVLMTNQNGLSTAVTSLSSCSKSSE